MLLFRYNHKNINFLFQHLSFEIQAEQKMYICSIYIYYYNTRINIHILITMLRTKNFVDLRKLFSLDNMIQRNVLSIMINYLVRVNLLR